MEYRGILSLLLASAMLAAGCKGGQNSGETEGDRLKYEPQVNEVEAITLERQDFQMQLLSNGKLSAGRKSALSFKSGGTLSQILATNGKSVAAGSIIARLDDTDQRLALESAQIAMDRAELDLKDVLAGQGYSSDDPASVPEEIMSMARMRSGWRSAKNQLAQAQNSLEGTVIKAPFAGKVADISHAAHDRVGTDTFCTLIDDSSFDVRFTVLESEYSFIGVGQEVRVSVFGDAGNEVRGRITSINPSIDKNGQIAVTARIPGGHGMIDGMNVKVIVEKSFAKQLVVPKSAVVIRDGLEVLFRYNNGKADWVYVNTLNANSESYAVTANTDRAARLEEGDMVIVSGNLNLADGSNVSLKHQ